MLWRRWGLYTVACVTVERFHVVPTTLYRSSIKRDDACPPGEISTLAQATTTLLVSTTAPSLALHPSGELRAATRASTTRPTSTDRKDLSQCVCRHECGFVRDQSSRR